MWRALRCATPNGERSSPLPTAHTSCPTSTVCPICCGPWPAGRRDSSCPPARRNRGSTMPIEVSVSPQVPDDVQVLGVPVFADRRQPDKAPVELDVAYLAERGFEGKVGNVELDRGLDRKSTRLNSSHPSISYAVFCLKK